MLTAISGYIDGNRVVVEENVSEWQGRKVVVTILDGFEEGRMPSNKFARDDARIAAANELAGLWKNHDDEPSVDAVVRSMRKGRRFDN